MKSMKMMLAAAVLFSVGLGFAATASARRAVDGDCYLTMRGFGYSHELSTVMCTEG